MDKLFQLGCGIELLSTKHIHLSEDWFLREKRKIAMSKNPISDDSTFVVFSFDVFDDEIGVKKWQVLEWLTFLLIV